MNGPNRYAPTRWGRRGTRGSDASLDTVVVERLVHEGWERLGAPPTGPELRQAVAELRRRGWSTFEIARHTGRSSRHIARVMRFERTKSWT